jgi:hypothetical protein
MVPPESELAVPEIAGVPLAAAIAASPAEIPSIPPAAIAR